MTLIRETLSGLELGATLTFQNLTLFPLLGDDSGAANYLTLDEALERKSLCITEVDSSGSVPDLKVVNEGELPVLLMDGEELVGAKQNRTLNVTILVPAHSSLMVPVTCVEAGRWAHTSQEFAAAPRAHYAAGRALKHRAVTDSMQERGNRYADQGAVWQDIAEKSSRMAAPSPTQAMAEMYVQHSANVNEFQAAFPAQPRQRGAAFAINGEIKGLDIFEGAMTLSKLLPKIVASYALDALDAPARNGQSPAASSEAMQRFLDSIAQADSETFPAVGLGEDVRLKAQELAGGGLIAEGRVVHLSVFAAPKSAERGGVSTPLRRASMRQNVWSANVANQDSAEYERNVAE